MTPPEPRIEAKPLNQPARYLVASAGALAVDLVIALFLREVFGLAVSVAAAISFVVVGFGAYFVHEHWTFRRAGSRTSPGRLARNIAASLAALATRVALIAIMEAIYDPGVLMAAVYIIIGAGASMTVNFLLNRFWVFADPR